MEVKHVACPTAIVLSVGTGLAVLAAATAVKTVAIIAFALLATALGGLLIASITAWADDKSTTPSKYFENIPKHAGYIITGLFTTIAQLGVAKLWEAIFDGVGKRVTRAIAGPDTTSETTIRHA